MDTADWVSSSDGCPEGDTSVMLKGAMIERSMVSVAGWRPLVVSVGLALILLFADGPSLSKPRPERRSPIWDPLITSTVGGTGHPIRGTVVALMLMLLGQRHSSIAAPGMDCCPASPPSDGDRGGGLRQTNQKSQ